VRDLEDHAYILDYLPQGRTDKRSFKREPLAYALGENEFKLFELTPKEDVNLTIGERVYIGKDVDLREAIMHVKRRVRYDDLTNAAQNELPLIIQDIVTEREKDFVRFYNESRAITTRFHMLELLPGLGKKSMWAIIEERKKKPFESFKDLEERISSVHRPDKLIAKRIEVELAEAEQKYHIFVAK
jgi:putative nucleotide binding protein